MTAPLLLTEKQAAAHTGVSLVTLRKWRKAGLIPVVRPYPEWSTRIYYRTADLDAYVASLAPEVTS